MNRWLTLIPIGLAAVIASCGSSVTSSTQPATNGGVVDYYTMEVSPNLFSLNVGDWASVTATVDLSYENGPSKPVSPQPTLKFYSSDSRVTVSPGGVVCAGQWDSLYQVCNATATLPTGYVTITARDVTHNVSGTTQLSVHPRAASITLSAPVYTGTVAAVPGTTATTIPVGEYPAVTNCISQNNYALVNGSPQSNVQVKYTATALDVNGNVIPNCSTNAVAGCVHDNDYTWTVSDATVGTVGQYGSVASVGPGVTNVFASLNGTISQPLAFATCPPKAIVLSTSQYTGTTPVGPYSTSDVVLNRAGLKYVTADMVDSNGNTLTSSTLNFITSDPLIGSFASFLPLTSALTGSTAGRFTFLSSCGPPSCNPTVGNFSTPANSTGASSATAASMGYGFPIYSNAIGATVLGQTGSTVLVTGTNFANGNPAYQLQTYDSESLELTHTIELANTPNSLVVAPNGSTAYVGSSDGLMVVDLTAYSSAIFSYPIVGALNTQQITGKVLGVSPDSRYVLISDTTNGFVFLIDTTGTKSATQFNIPNITAATFAPDDSGFWIGGASGVYNYYSDAFVPITGNSSDHVTSLAWMADGQTLFASGTQLADYATCNSLTPPLRPGLSGYLPSTVTNGLATTALSGTTHLLGLNGSQWFDYPFSSSAQVPVPQSVSSPNSLAPPSGSGDICLSGVTANAPVTAASTAACTATQVTYSSTLDMEFITGVDPSCTASDLLIHGYDAVNQTEITLTTATPTIPVVPLSGGVLSDGRKLYYGTWDQATATAALHRIDLSTGTTVTSSGTLAADGSHTEDLSIPVTIVPSFVAVVPR